MGNVRVSAGAGVMALALAAVGCSREAAPPPDPIAVEQAPQALTNTFAQAKEATRELSTGAAEAIQGGRYSDAYLLLQQLGSKSDLSPTERETLNQTRVGLMQRVQEAAAHGDSKAAQLLEHHRASK